MFKQININKIIDKIFKKLLKNDFEKSEIWYLINLKEQFSSFENYLYYLMVIGQKKHNDTMFSMARSINSYIVTLLERYNIQNKLIISNLLKGDQLTDIELYLLGVKGYGTNNNFYFDNENNLYICLNNVKYFEHNNIYNFKLNDYCDGFLNSKINQKIIKNNVKKVLLFSRQNEKNIFLGFYKILRLNHFYIGAEQLFGFTVINEEGYEQNDLIEFDNLMKRECDTSLNKLKNELIEIVSNVKNDTFNLLNIISMNDNHICLIYQILQHGLITNNRMIINELKRKYKEMIFLDFNIFSLVPNLSIISEYYLVLLANCLDILYGKQINTDYMNNIIMCFNSSSMNFEDENKISVRFIKSYYGRYFDLEENKIIFNTSIEPTAIYLFQKNNANNYLFLGFYKVVKVYIDYDLEKNEAPTFILRKLSSHEMIDHINYVLENKVTNCYKNHFKNLKNNNSFPSKWLNDTNIIETKLINTANDQVNSLLKKYNWIIKKSLINFNNEKFDKYFKNYIEFDNRIINWIFKVLSYDFYFLINNKLMEPHAIAYEMTKRNWGTKELFDISYPDHYFTKKAKYDICLNIIDCKNK